MLPREFFGSRAVSDSNEFACNEIGVLLDLQSEFFAIHYEELFITHFGGNHAFHQCFDDSTVLQGNICQKENLRCFCLNVNGENYILSLFRVRSIVRNGNTSL